MNKKNILRYFLFFFLLFFFIFNWEKINFIFYPEYLWRATKYFFSRSKATPSQTQTVDVIQPFPENTNFSDFEFTEKENSLEIPSLEIFAPLILVNSETEIEKGLEKGLVLHPNSVFPPNPGRTIVLGHSARHKLPKNIPVWVFTYLPEIKEGDEIILNLNHKRFHYFVEKKFIAKEDEDLEDSKTENLLYLITCWPPGRLVFKQRLVVLAKMR